MWASLVVAITLCLGQAAETTHAADAAYAALPPAEAAGSLREIRQADAALHGALAAEFVAVVNRSMLGPDVGPHSKTLRFNSTGAQQALTVEYAYARNPEFRPPPENGAAGGDYDADGNLIVWRPLRRWCFRSAELNRMVSEREALLIDPAGQIIRRTQGRHLEDYAADSPNGFYELRQCWEALGREIGEQLPNNATARRTASGYRYLFALSTVELSLDIGLPRNWEVLLDNQHPSLVRMMQCRLDSGSDPVWTVVNDGTVMSGDVCVAARGTLRYSEQMNHQIDVTCTLLSRQPDVAFIQEVHELAAGEQPDGTQATDFRAGEARSYIVGMAAPDSHE